MSKQLLYISIVFLFLLTSCHNYVCPAYESAFNRGSTPYDKYFSFLPNDTLPRDERMLISPEFFAYFDKNSNFVPVGNIYLDDKGEKASSLVKNIFIDNRQEKFRNGEGKISKKGIQKKRIKDLLVLYTPIKGRKNIQGRNHSNVIRSFPTLPLPEIFELDKPVIDEIDEPFLLVNKDSLLLHLQPEDTTLVASNDTKKIDPFPQMGFDQWYYEQEFGYLLKNSTQNIALDTLTQDMMELDSMTLASEQKGIKGFFKRINGKFKKKKKEETLAKKKKRLEFKDLFKQEKNKSEKIQIIDSDNVFDDDDLEDLFEEEEVDN